MVERESGREPPVHPPGNYVFLAFIGIICLYPFLYGGILLLEATRNQFIKHDFTVLWAPGGFSTGSIQSMCSQVNWVPAI